MAPLVLGEVAVLRCFCRGDDERHRRCAQRNPQRGGGEPPPAGPTHGPDDVVNGDFTVVTEQLVTLGLPDRVANAIPLEEVSFDKISEGPGGAKDGFLLNVVTLLPDGS